MITHYIAAAAVKHEVLTGQKPTKLYLGRIESEELKELTWKAPLFRTECDVIGGRRPEFWGLKIFTVDDESYVAVGV